ncbi:LOW QUALITY PROTEIN: armadillo repeat-containing protein 5 [Silurus meridionalis]|uniref:LOW QUALITY PROTEIN: armadillo repeat-containing protein 5 n=1 Tax=Silurus meridionalis TaxID=175797 RepID=UPI001EEC3D7E|nr:LOW QUALITY PROTEIN: armadillo repeat-containing protein 5 [Silurus meridionalis]
MATQTEDEGHHSRSRPCASSPSPESSLTWCLVQLNKFSPIEDVLPGSESKTSRDADKRLRAGQWRALVAIRTHHIKGGSVRIGRYQAQGGLPPLLAVLRRPESSRKILDLTLSILANCCTEKDARAEVRKLGGVSLIVEVLKRHASVETVENRAARALGNLAMDPEGSAQIHSAGGVPPLLLCLSLSSSPTSPPSPSIVSPPTPPAVSSSTLERAQSAARALFYLSDTPSNRLSLLSQGALPALGLFLASEYPPVLRRACLRALNELTRGCGAECAREVSVSGVLSHLGSLASGDGGGALEELAIKTLANLCSQGCLRPLVGSLGIIQKFTEEAKKDLLKSSVVFKALCLCCKEAVNRVKVKESGGLEVLIGFLSAYQSHPLTRLAILACVDFVYDEAALEQLQELGLVPILVTRLIDLTRGDDMKMDAARSQCSELASCFESFDFPSLEGSRKDESGKEQASPSFLSLRSWLLSEGFISSEVELMKSPFSSDRDSSSHTTCSPPSAYSSLLLPSYSLPSPLTSGDVSPSQTQPKPVSSPSACSKPCRLSVCSSPLSASSTSSTTQLKPPPPPSASTCKVSSPPRKRARTSSLSTCLSIVSLDTPPTIPKTPGYQHPYHPEPWAPESPILLLLSRFSHATDPSGTLVTVPVFSALLYYLTQHHEPSGRCCRMLVRISCNLNCLQPLVRTGAIALIRRRLCLCDQDRSAERQSDRVKAKIRQLGQGLLNNLRVQSETGFGSGVLTHIVLSGSESDKIFCVLSLPLITGNRILLKKLLLDNGGLSSALKPLLCLDGAEDDSADKCRTLLSTWICPPEQGCASGYHLLYASLLIGCLSCLVVGSKIETDRPLESPQQDLDSVSSPCLYQTSNHDVSFLLDDGSLLPANGGMVSGEVGMADAESEYFRALLRGQFDEAQRAGGGDAVHIRDVTPGMVLPVLHYLHGCRMTGDRDGGRHCPVLTSLLSKGLKGHPVFEKTPLAEVMIGASRFLVPGLQRTAEDLCVSQMCSLASKAGSQSPSKATDEASEDGTLSFVLPQAYWFSQRYSYSRLGLSCLSILLRPQLPPSISSDCLLRLVRQADSTESLRQDLLSLASAALS